MRVAELDRVVPRPVVVAPRSRYGRRLKLLLSVWRRASELDRQLTAGIPPHASAALTVRARRLTGPRCRTRAADGLARVLLAANDTSAGFRSAVRPDVGEVLAAQAVVVALERRLRAQERIAPRGMAMLYTLLTDPTGPLYQRADPGALGSRLRAAAAALEPSDRGIDEPARAAS